MADLWDAVRDLFGSMMQLLKKGWLAEAGAAPPFLMKGLAGVLGGTTATGATGAVGGDGGPDGGASPEFA